MDARLLADLEALLQQQRGAVEELAVAEQLRPHVWRLTVGSTASSVPASVIARVGPSRAEGSLEPGIGWAAVFANEWAGSLFLERLEPVGDAVPKVLAHDLEAQLLVVEDLGTGPSLATLLNGGDPERVSAALIAHAGLLGRIAAASHGRTAEYDRLRRQVGPATAASLLDELSSEELRRVLPRVEQELGITPPVGLDTELTAIDHETREPGRWGAYTPADACPDNNVVTPHGVRLFDFGFGGLRHIALDAAYSVIPFPTCWCYGPLPASVSDAMLVAFRHELVPSLPEAGADDIWEEKLAFATAAWFVGFIGAVAVGELDREQPRGHLSGPQAAVAQLESVAQTAEQHFPATSDLARRMAAALRERWHVGRIDPYPVFDAAPSDGHSASD
jgi:hypothetical protein